MLTIISLDYVPGVCDQLVPYFHKDDFVVLPTHTDIEKHGTITTGIGCCLHNILVRLQHIQRCKDTEQPLVCTHWYAMPIQVLGTDLEHVVVQFLERHTRDLIRVMGIKEYQHVAVVLRVNPDECLERMISNMDGREVGIHHIHMYTSHLAKVPRTYRVSIPHDGLDVKYTCERIVGTIQSILHGL